MKYTKRVSVFLLILLPIIFMSCRSPNPIRSESFVDLTRFMGDWYVMANIPTFLEKDAWNAIENYELRDDGVIATTFTFNKGAPEGPRKEFHPKGFVRDPETNALWGMQFVWPFKAEYIVVYVDDAYTETIIGRRKRDYLWLMTRSPDHPEDRIAAMIDLAVEEGYDRSKIQRVPHASKPE
jgi:apolipoprotein D and lipocalin family protein